MHRIPPLFLVRLSVASIALLLGVLPVVWVITIDGSGIMRDRYGWLYGPLILAALLLPLVAVAAGWRLARAF